MELFSALKAFIRVADSGQFSTAARRIGLSVSRVSRMIQALEKEYGVRLFNRSTRRVQLTEAGEALLGQAKLLVEQADEFRESASRWGGGPRGLLRISVPMDFGSSRLLTVFSSFAQSYPDIRLEICFDDHQLDILDQSLDAVIRIGHMQDSALVAKPLGQAAIGLYASPAYLEVRGHPNTPQELLDHRLLKYTLEQDPNQWQFSGPQGKVTIRPRWQLAANNGKVLAAWAEQGLGIARLPDFVVEDQCSDGRLKRLLPEYCKDTLPISLVYPHRSFKPGKLLAFMRHLELHLLGLSRAQ